MESQLKWLLDYTLFHIGAYITLSTLLVAILGLEGFKQRISTMKWFLLATLVCFVVAGVGGGVVASNIPFYKDISILAKDNIGPSFGWPMRPLVWWTTLEHGAFWFGVFWAMFGVTLTVLRRPVRATAAFTVETARKLAKDCFDAAVNVRADDAERFKNKACELLEIAKEAEKSDQPA